MPYNLENKVSYDELAPSLQNRFSGIDSMRSKIDSMDSKIGKNETTMNSHISDSNVHFTQANKTAIDITNSESPIKKYIDDKDFLNLSPKIGFFGETQVPINSTYNTSLYRGNAFRIISDSDGQEIAYFSAAPDPNSPTKLYKATRNKTTSSFMFFNDPLIPAYLSSGSFLVAHYGLGNDYLSASVNINGATEYHIIKTNATSLPKYWKSYINITSIIGPILANTNITLYNIMYFGEYDTFCIFYKDRSGNSFHLSLYKAANLSLIITKEIFNLNNVIDLGNNTGGIGLAASTDFCYIKNKEILVLKSSCYGTLQNKTSGVKSGVYRFVTQFINIPKTFFSNGTGSTTSIIANDQYKIDTECAGMSRPNQYGASSGSLKMVYDEFDNIIRTAHQTQGNVYSLLYYQNGKDTINYNNSYILSNPVIDTITTLDICPWAKYFDAPLFMGNNVYLRCMSQKYGYTNTKIDYRAPIDKTSRVLDIIGGTWWVSKYHETDNIALQMTNQAILSRTTTIRKSSTETEWVYMQLNTPNKKMQFENFVGADGKSYSGKRSFIDSPYPIIPSLPTKYTHINHGAGYYNPYTGRAYYIVYDNTSSDFASFILSYDFGNKVFTEHKNISSRWSNGINYSISAWGGKCIALTGSNMFIDLDGSMYIMLGFHAPDGIGVSGFIKITDLGNNTISITDIALIRNSHPWCSVYLSYDNNLGYCVGRGDPGGPIIQRIECSKDYITNNTEKTSAQFFNNETYTVKFSVKGSVGLVANLPSIPIFLGGYFSQLESKEISLYPNCDNYIYLKRDSSNRDIILTEIKTKKYSNLNTGSNFNRILIAKITTDSENVISQELYDISSSSENIKIVTGTIGHGGTIPLPEDFTQEQCKWIVSPYYLEDYATGADINRFTCYTNANRVLNCTIEGYGDSSHTIANYMIIGIK